MANKVSDEKLLLTLLSTSTIQDASEQLGVSRQTIYNKMKEPTFQAEYNKAKSEILTHICGYLQGNIAKAIECIIDIMQDFTTNEQTRLNSARALIDYSLKFTETADIVSRIDKLEQSQNGGDFE